MCGNDRAGIDAITPCACRLGQNGNSTWIVSSGKLQLWKGKSEDLVWWDYAPETMGYIEQWLDDAAVKTTGLDKGFRSFYEYWANEEGYIPGENFWCKVISKDAQPLAVIAFCEYERKVIIMELLIAPEKRGQGMGTEILKELLGNKNIIGFGIENSEAVIFPGNMASQKAFEKAGFYHHRTHEDGDALYYVFRKGSA